MNDIMQPCLSIFRLDKNDFFATARIYASSRDEATRKKFRSIFFQYAYETPHCPFTLRSFHFLFSNGKDICDKETVVGMGLFCMKAIEAQAAETKSPCVYPQMYYWRLNKRFFDAGRSVSMPKDELQQCCVNVWENYLRLSVQEKDALPKKQHRAMLQWLHRHFDPRPSRVSVVREVRSSGSLRFYDLSRTHREDVGHELGSLFGSAAIPRQPAKSRFGAFLERKFLGLGIFLGG